MLGVLRRTCPLIKNTRVRRSLYLSLVKCHLNYATELWSPSQISLKRKIESVQRRVTRWILQQRKREQSYKDRLVTLNLIPLCYDREIKDLVLFYKALYGYIELDISKFVSFVPNGRTRSSHVTTLKTPFCRTSTFQSSYFNRIVKLWNNLIVATRLNSLSSLRQFKRFITGRYKLELIRTFDLTISCTWTLVGDCSCHRLY